MPEIDLYLRKSARDREGVNAPTFEVQEARGRRWASDNSYTVRKVWKDNLSAWTDTERPEFDKGVAALLADESDALWVYALDRFSRKGALEGGVPAVLNAGKRLIADYERLDSSDPRDRRRIIDMAEQAREYSELLSYRVGNAKAAQREKGEWLGKAPYGLSADPKTRKLSPNDKWHIVMALFRAVASGRSTRSIAKRMNEFGIPSAEGKQWRATTIQQVIRHPAYEGLQVAQGTPKRAYRNERGEHVSVMADGVSAAPADLVRRARAALEGRTPIARRRPGVPKHLLADLLKCGGCFGPMSAAGRSYQCSNIIAGARCANAASAMIGAIDRYVTDVFLSRIPALEPEDELLAVIAERWQSLTRPNEGAELLEARAALQRAQERLERILADSAAGRYKRALPLYERLYAEADAEVGYAEQHVAELALPGVDITFLLEPEMLAARWEHEDEHARRDLLRLAIDRIYVSRSPKRGVPFDGHERVTFEWATPAE